MYICYCNKQVNEMSDKKKLTEEEIKKLKADKVKKVKEQVIVRK